MIVKINLVKVINKYLKLMKSSVILHFLKRYFKDIKEYVLKIQANLNRQEIV